MNLNNDQTITYWLSMSNALFFLIARESEWTEPIEFPMEEGEPTEQVKKLYTRPEPSAQVPFF